MPIAAVIEPHRVLGRDAGCVVLWITEERVEQHGGALRGSFRGAIAERRC